MSPPDPITSAIAWLSRREGSRSGVAQLAGQPRSYCGQSPWTTKPVRRRGSHCGSFRPWPSVAHHEGDQLSART